MRLLRTPPLLQLLCYLALAGARLSKVPSGRQLPAAEAGGGGPVQPQGLPREAARPLARPERRLVVGGAAAESGQSFPYMCSMRSQQGQHECGATLIAPRLAVSRARSIHCMNLSQRAEAAARRSGLNPTQRPCSAQVTAAYCVSPPLGAGHPTLWCGLLQQRSQAEGTYDVLRTVRTTV